MFNHLLIILKIILKSINVLKLILKNQITGYPNCVNELENKFANFIDKNYAVSFCNGTSSIEAAIYALNLPKGSEILIPSSIFHASIGPIRKLNFKIKFIDVNIQTLTVNKDIIKNNISSNTSAVIIVHPWGYPADSKEIKEICQKNNLKLIEDCSHSHGAMVYNKKTGYYGDISCFSLQGSKAIAAGEGGICVTDSKEYFTKLSFYGHFNRNSSELIECGLSDYKDTGFSNKLRMNPLGSAMALVDLKYIDKINNNKEFFYKKIDSLIEDSQSFRAIIVEKNCKRGGYFGGYPIFIKDENKINNYLNLFNKYKIKYIKYPWLLHHKMKIFNGNENLSLINTEKIHKQVILISISQKLDLNLNNLRKLFKNCDEI